MSENIVTINRAPVLTLWAAVVAERLSYDQDAALTLGKAVAGLNAQAKGCSIGLFHLPQTGAVQEGAVYEDREVEAGRVYYYRVAAYEGELVGVSWVTSARAGSAEEPEPLEGSEH
jgi:hypothetical protein